MCRKLYLLKLAEVRVIAELNISSQLRHFNLHLNCNFKTTSVANSQMDQNFLVCIQSHSWAKVFVFS